MKRFADNFLFNYVWWLMAALMISAITLQGCETFGGYQNVDTTRKAILVANAEIRAGNLLLQDLVRRDVIGRDNAQKALLSLREAHGSLQTALDAVDTGGDPVTAQSGLDRANRALNAALIVLSAFTGEP